MSHTVSLATIVAILSLVVHAERAQQPLEIPQDEAFRQISALNDKSGFVAPLFGKLRFNNLRAENCFGVELREGTRLLGESSADDYGMEMSYSGEEKQVAIGLVFVEGRISLGGKPVTPAAYVAFSSSTTLTLLAEGPPGRGAFSARASYDQPFPPAAIAGKAPDRPLLRVAVEGPDVFLVVGTNRIQLGLQ